MKNRKKLIALLAVALLIPMTVLAAACQHSRKGSTYNKTSYVFQNPLMHTKVVTPVRDCIECGKTFTAGTATRIPEGHTRRLYAITDKHVVSVDPLRHVFEATKRFACTKCGSTNLPTETYRYSEFHNLVYARTEYVGLVPRDVYHCTICGRDI